MIYTVVSGGLTANFEAHRTNGYKYIQWDCDRRIQHKMCSVLCVWCLCQVVHRKFRIAQRMAVRLATMLSEKKTNGERFEIYKWGGKIFSSFLFHYYLFIVNYYYNWKTQIQISLLSIETVNKLKQFSS